MTGGAVMNDYKTYYARFRKNNPHIIAYRTKKWIVLIVKWLIAVGAIMAIAIISGPSPPTMLPIGVVAAIGLPLWWLKPWRYVKFHWLGTIESIRYEDAIENDDGSSINPRYSGRHDVTYAHFTVRDAKGKKHTFKLDRQYEAIYHLGDHVMRISGIDYPIDLTVQDKLVCPRCGSIYPRENERCVGVGCKMPAIILDDTVI